MTEYTRPRDRIKKIFSVLRTKPFVKEVFSIVTCIYRCFDSQAPENRIKSIYKFSLFRTLPQACRGVFYAGCFNNLLA